MSTRSSTSSLRPRSPQTTKKKTAREQMTTRSKRKPKLSNSVRSKRYPLEAQRSKRSPRKNAGKEEISRRKIGPQRTSKKSIPTIGHTQSFPRRRRSSLRVSAKRAVRLSSNRRSPARRRDTRVPDVLNFISERLDHEWSGYLKHLQVFRQKASVKNVHDLRVSIRRLMTCLELIERLSPDNAVRRARITLKEQMSELSDLRDAHVEMVAIRSYLKQLPEIKQFYDEFR